MTYKLIVPLTFFLLIPNLYSDSFSIMNFNAQNLFDTLDDVDKDDKAYLPIEQKQSSEQSKFISQRLKEVKSELRIEEEDMKVFM